jgi:hypothetical protein
MTRVGAERPVATRLKYRCEETKFVRWLAFILPFSPFRLCFASMRSRQSKGERGREKEKRVRISGFANGLPANPVARFFSETENDSLTCSSA